ncbi:MAG: VOC family protein [Bacteriovoracaceae bacterium]|nr:VOC family protein [Bacteriovoracaceae bacterium]
MKLGYTLIYVDDLAATMEFYSEAFGMEKGFLHESNQYGEMQTGQTKLGFVQHETASSHGFKYEKLGLDRTPAGFEIGLISEDVEAAFKKALDAGAESVCSPEKKPWGQMVSYVKDNNGVLVEICSSMS